MARKIRKTTILGKIETAYSTDATPTGAANAIQIINPRITPLKQELVSRDLVRQFLGNSEQLEAAAWSMIEFETEVAGSGAAGTAPAWGPLMRGCGMGETITASTKVEYKPISAAEESLTIYGNWDGVQHKMLGCRGTFSLDLVARQRPTIKWQFTGLYVPATDTALPTLTLTAWQKPLAVNNANTSAFTLHGFAGILQSLSIAMNVAPEYRNLVGAEDVQITDRAPNGRVSIEAPTIAQKDWYTIAKNATLGALSITHGTVAGNKFKIDAPNTQILEPAYGEQTKIVFKDMGLSFMPGASGNDEITITAL